MKTITLVAALFASTSAYAGEITSTTVTNEFTHGDFTLSVDSWGNGLFDTFDSANKIGLEWKFFEGEKNDLSFYTSANLSYTNENIASIGVEAGVSKYVSTNAELYARGNLDYITFANDFDNGWVTFKPVVGVNVDLSNKLTAFGEVGSSFDVSNDFKSPGEYVKLGAEYAVFENLDVSLAVTKNSANDNTDLLVGTSFNF